MTQSSFRLFGVALILAAGVSQLPASAQTPPEPSVDSILAANGAIVGTNTFLVPTQTFSFTSGTFGFFLDDHAYVGMNGKPRGGVWYTQTALDSDGAQHVDVYKEGTSTYYLAFEDRLFPQPAPDFNDLVVKLNGSQVTKIVSDAGIAGSTLFGFYPIGDPGKKTTLWNDGVANGTTAHVGPVPEASTTASLGLLLALGLGGLILSARKQKAKGQA